MAVNLTKQDVVARPVNTAGFNWDDKDYQPELKAKLEAKALYIWLRSGDTTKYFEVTEYYKVVLALIRWPVSELSTHVYQQVKTAYTTLIDIVADPSPYSDILDKRDVELASEVVAPIFELILPEP